MQFGKLFQETISRKKLKDTDETVFIGMQDVDDNATIKKYSKLRYSQIKTGFTYFEKKDVLVAKITPCFENGKGGFADNIPTETGFGSTEFHVLRAKENVDPRYIYFQTKRKRFRNELEGEMVGSAGHRRVPFSSIQKFELEVEHSKEEQTAIAKALSDVDALITSLERLITKKRTIKTAAMQQLLTGKKRLPPFDKTQTGYKQTELGEIPEDWEVGELSSVCAMKSGESVTSADLDDGAKYQCFGGNGLRGRIDRFTHDGNYALVGRQGALCGNVVRVCGAFFASEHAIVVTPSKQANIDWLAYILRRMNLNQYSESSAQPGLSVSKLLRFSLAIPPKDEQDAIADVISDMDKEIEAIEQRLTKTQQLKQGMMQELLTGKTRLV